MIIGIIGIILLASFPIVASSENLISNEPPDNKPVIKGDVEFKVFGFKNFYVWVKNNKDEQITVYVNYTMEFGELGANSTIYPFPVKPHRSTFIFWDCQPMPFYYITIRCEAAGQNFTKHGDTILGFNFFFRNR